MKYNVVTLSTSELRMIADGLKEAADLKATVQVMIQEDGLKFKMNYGTWTAPLGRVENR